MPDPFDPPPPDPLDTELPGEHPEDDEGVRLGGIVPDILRKAVVAGLGAVFMSEEGIRKLGGQLKLPKEALGFILSQADKTKSEVTRVIGEELRRFLNSELLRQELLQMLTGVTVEVKAEIRLRPDPDAKGQVLPNVELTGTEVKRPEKHRKGKKEGH
jgi:hypothetical protein